MTRTIYNGRGKEWLKDLFYSFYEVNYPRFADNEAEWARKRVKRFIYTAKIRHIEGLDK
jgi:hypothetical protein